MLACSGGMGTTDTDTAVDTGTSTENLDTAGCVTDNTFSGFVTRDSDQLFLNGEQFRFVSFNVPNLHVLENPVWDLPTAWEQADAMCSIQQMGGRVARIYVLSVGESQFDLPRHVVAPGEFNEELFVALDQAVAQAESHGIRLILPFVDQWWWWGGIADYAAFRGLEENDFWTDEQVISDFEETVRFLIERVNTVTGVAYRDDPTILAWETGNELDSPSEWTERIAALIKDLDPNHLVMDGHYGIDQSQLENPDIDVVSDHYYGSPPFWEDYASAAAAGQAIAAGFRPFVIGEFGLQETSVLTDLLDTVVSEGITGSMIWSLRFHKAEGGFYWHTEIETGDTLFRAYHWPGFESGDAYDETEILQRHRQAAYEVQGLEVPDLLAPSPPTILQIDDPTEILWQGSTGATSYSLERAEGQDGAWDVIEIGIDDALVANSAKTADSNLVRGGRHVLSDARLGRWRTV
jgi:hypothetical protein